MNIVFIVPGTGGSFYCENCLRDLSLINSLKKKGHSVSVIPLYLPYDMNPLTEIPEDIRKRDIPVFYGAINLYLKHFYPMYEKFPRWMKKILDSNFFLKQAAGMSSSTDSSGLNDLTISMLKGEDGRQTGELDAMLKWIAPNIKPDVIHISTALLSGMAKRLKRLFNVPVISFFQDEDTWIDAMDANSKEDAWDIIEKKAADIDAFVFPSEFYRKKMTSRIGIPEHKQHVVYNGLDPSLYERSKHPASGKFIVGFLSRICRENGLEFLVDAFIEM
jgi:glycosyltransferase involved in cell wall biosynthesis